MVWNSHLSSLRRILVHLYPEHGDIIRILDEAGIARSNVGLQSSPANNWHSVITEAEKNGRISAVVLAAQNDYPDNAELLAFAHGHLTPIDGPTFTGDLDWHGAITEGPLEKLISREETLVPVSFLDAGLKCQKSVARIQIDNAFGSGFLIDHNLLVTNNHVLPNAVVASRAVAQFNYQTNLDGSIAPVASFRLLPDEYFRTSRTDDWSIVRVAEDPNSLWGALELHPSSLRPGDRVNIIQHPGGGHKQMSFFHNRVTYVDQRVLQYATDTLPGSSGSPVFDRDWHVVAVHHSGGDLVIPNSSRRVYANEGVRIELVIDAIKA